MRASLNFLLCFSWEMNWKMSFSLMDDFKLLFCVFIPFSYSFYGIYWISSLNEIGITLKCCVVPLIMRYEEMTKDNTNLKRPDRKHDKGTQQLKRRLFISVLLSFSLFFPYLFHVCYNIIIIMLFKATDLILSLSLAFYGLSVLVLVKRKETYTQENGKCLFLST